MATIIVKKKRKLTVTPELQQDKSVKVVECKLENKKPTHLTEKKLAGEEIGRLHNQRQEEIKQKRIANCRTWMKKNFPFTSSRLPLKVGASKDLIAEYRKQGISIDEFSATTIIRRCERLTSKLQYLENMTKEDSKRHDLYGNVVCEVDEKHRKYANELLSKFKKAMNK